MAERNSVYLSGIQCRVVLLFAGKNNVGRNLDVGYLFQPGQVVEYHNCVPKSKPVHIHIYWPCLVYQVPAALHNTIH